MVAIRCCPGRGRGKNAKYSSACFGMFADDRRAEKNHSVDAKSDEVREGEDAAASGRWRHQAVARRGKLAFRLVADVVQRGVRCRGARKFVAAFVFRVSGMAFDPFPFNLMLA